MNLYAWEGLFERSEDRSCKKKVPQTLMRPDKKNLGSLIGLKEQSRTRRRNFLDRKKMASQPGKKIPSKTLKGNAKHQVLRTCTQRRTDMKMIVIAHPIITAVSPAFTMPMKNLSGCLAKGRKLSQIFCQPAVSVVTATKIIGPSVIPMYRAL